MSPMAIDVPDVCAHLPIDRDEALVANFDAGPFRADPSPIRLPANGYQDQIVALRLIGRRFARERDIDAVRLRIDRRRLCLQHDLVEAVSILFLPDGNQIPVGSRHQAIEHFHDLDPRTQDGIDGGHFQSNDAAAEN